MQIFMPESKNFFITYPIGEVNIFYLARLTEIVNVYRIG